jgi:hypothetical protein
VHWPVSGPGGRGALAAVSLGIKMIYWYTYGPDHGKGDNFCEPFFHKIVSKAARIIAAAEAPG